jgi:hypothetical protein
MTNQNRRSWGMASNCVKRRVVTHPTCEITDEILKDFFGEDYLMVRHDLVHEGGHECQTS